MPKNGAKNYSVSGSGAPKKTSKTSTVTMTFKRKSELPSRPLAQSKSIPPRTPAPNHLLPPDCQQESSGVPPRHPDHHVEGASSRSVNSSSGPCSRKMGDHIRQNVTPTKETLADQTFSAHPNWGRSNENPLNDPKGQVPQGHRQGHSQKYKQGKMGNQGQRRQPGTKGHPGQKVQQVHQSQRDQQAGRSQRKSERSGQTSTGGPPGDFQQRDHHKLTSEAASAGRQECQGNSASFKRFPLPLESIPRGQTMDVLGDSGDVMHGSMDGELTTNDPGSRDDNEGEKIKPTMYEGGSREKIPQFEEVEKELRELQEWNQTESKDAIGQQGQQGQQGEEEIEGRIESQEKNTLSEEIKVKEGESRDVAVSAGGQTIKPTTAKEYEGPDKVKVEGHDKVNDKGNEKGESVEHEDVLDEFQDEIKRADYREDKKYDQRQSTKKEREKKREGIGNEYEDGNQNGDDPGSDENGKSEKDDLKTDSEDTEEVLKKQFIEENFKVHSSGKLKICQAKLKKVFEDDESGIRKLEFGQNTPKIGVPEKVLMLVGATGSGKSTMINAILNFIFGVQWSDDYRLKLVADETPTGQKVNQAVSQTQWITAYTIHYQPWFKDNFSITIIDTPGFGDTRGIKRDREIMEQIRNFFNMGGSNGIDHLDVVGFVTQASLARLGHIQRYIFESILSIFGKDIQENIFMLLTFADGRKPQVLSGLAEANMKYANFYKFNNSALFTGASSQDDDSDGDDYDEDEDDFGEMFWMLGANNFTKFMNDMDITQEKSLIQTREVLEERLQLEITISSINENIKEGLKTLQELDTQQKLLKEHEADLDRNKHFSYQVQRPTMEKQYLRSGIFATICQECQHTCHYQCNCGNLEYCKAFRFNWIYCKRCPKRCKINCHKRRKYIYVKMFFKHTVQSNEIKDKYQEAKGKTLSAKEMIKCCNEDYQRVQKQTWELIRNARKCLERLEEIALKPNPLSTTDYIDLMIQEELFLKQPGWRETVQQLQQIKQQAKDFHSVATGQYSIYV